MVFRVGVFRFVLHLRSFAVVVGAGWVEGGEANGVGTGFFGGSSMRVVVSTYIMIVFAAFVICWVVSATQGTFRQRVRSL